MNIYLVAQCKHIIEMVNAFELNCKMGALKDDGMVSKEEAKLLKKINIASSKFKKSVGNLK